MSTGRKTAITQKEIEEIFKFAEEDERFGVAFRGALSQIRLKIHLQSHGYVVENTQSDNAGKPDFIINGKTMEHKRARNEAYSDGCLKVELQKSRGKVPERLYDNTFCDFVSADVSEHTGIKNDYRYARTNDLRRHRKYENKISSIQRIDQSWTSDLRALLDSNK